MVIYLEHRLDEWRPHRVANYDNERSALDLGTPHSRHGPRLLDASTPFNLSPKMNVHILLSILTWLSLSIMYDIYVCLHIRSWLIWDPCMCSWILVWVAWVQDTSRNVKKIFLESTCFRELKTYSSKHIANIFTFRFQHFGYVACLAIFLSQNSFESFHLSIWL